MLPVEGFARSGATRFFGVDQNALRKGVWVMSHIWRDLARWNDNARWSD